MTTLRNQVIEVKELKKRFVTGKIQLLQLSSETTSSIEKSVIKSRGFSKVTGLKIEDVKNPRFEASRVGEVNPISGSRYMETEFRTLTNWIFE